MEKAAIHGRPPGARNKLSWMVEEGIRRAEAEMAKPVMLDLNVPYGVWDGCYEQFGRIFRFDTLQLKNPEAFILPQLKMVDVGRRRQEITWKNRDYFIQDGWLYDRATWMAVKILIGVC